MTCRIKPLVWVQSGGSHVMDGESHTVPSGYTVRYDDENGWKWQASGIGAYGWSASPSLAKAAAQADYAARIMSALEPTDPLTAALVLPEIKAAVDALKLMKSTYPYNPPCLYWEDQVEAHKAAKHALAALTKEGE